LGTLRLRLTGAADFEFESERGSANLFEQACVSVFERPHFKCNVTNTKRLTHEGAKRITATAIDKAREAGIAISIAVTDAGGHVIVLERMDGGRFHTLHSATTKAVCASSTRRSTSALGAQGQELDFAYVVGLALAAGPERWTPMEGGFAVRATFRFRHLARPALIAALIVVIVERSAIKDRNQMRR
jgi:uncharacterized protein GlcG (DUF336 family)